MQSVCVCTWPPPPDAGPPGCGCCSSGGSVCPAAPPAPPLVAAAAPSSSHGPASEPPSWPPTPRALVPRPWTLPPESHTGPRFHCSGSGALHAGSSGMLDPPVCFFMLCKTKGIESFIIQKVHFTCISWLI